MEISVNYPSTPLLFRFFFVSHIEANILDVRFSALCHVNPLASGLIYEHINQLHCDLFSLI